MKDKHTLVDNTAEARYEFDLDGDTALIEYIRRPQSIALTHTFVPERYEGRGIGKELVEAVLTDIRAQGLTVVPLCTFVAQYIVRHPEWEEIVCRETGL